MRFLIAALVVGLASIAHADAHESHGGDKKRKKKFKFVYDWGVSIKDNNLGRDTEDDADFKVRGIKPYLDAEVHYKKEWDGLSLKISHDLNDGLEKAQVTAELPRSYLSMSLGRGLLDAGGWQEYSSPYLSYHNPFPSYATMMRVFAPMEGVGELSLMVTSDVKEDDDDTRWHNDDDAIIGMLQYKGTFGAVSPLLQFSMYDYKASGDDDDNGGAGWQSWVLAAGLKFALHNLTVHLDYIHDNRKNKDADDGKDASTTVFRNYTAGVFFEHGMIGPWASFSMLMTANDDDRYDGIEGNFMPPGEDSEDSDGDNDTDYEKLVKGAFGADSYGDLESYQKFSTNMMVFNAGVEIKCMEDKLIPYVSYTMKMHKIDPNWQDEDSDLEDQVSHSVSLGVYGSI